MSRITELAYENAKKTRFVFKDNRTIEVMDASILWPDFTGKITEYHKILGERRSFNLVINQDMLEALQMLERQTGTKFRVHEINLFSDQDVKEKGVEQVILYYINVKVNMDNAFPPIVTLYTEYNGKRTHNTLNRDTIGQLDSVDMEHADMILNIYSSKLNTSHCSAYLKKLNVIQNPQVEFDGRYDDWYDERRVSEDRIEDSIQIPINPATGEPY